MVFLSVARGMTHETRTGARSKLTRRTLLVAEDTIEGPVLSLDCLFLALSLFLNLLDFLQDLWVS